MRWLILWFALVGAAPVWAGELDEVVAAEMAGDWSLASQLLNERLAQQPDRRDLWLRLSQVHAAAGEPQAAAAAVLAAAALPPPDAQLYAEAARALAVAEQPLQALAQMQEALRLAPENPDYALALVDLANWAGRYDLAEAQLRVMLAKNPQTSALPTRLGQVLTWQWRLNQAAEVLTERLKSEPADIEAALILTRVQVWRGNYSAAQAAIESYREHGGEEAVWRGEAGMILAAADRPLAALDVLAPLQENQTDNYRSLMARSLALHRARRFQRAQTELGQLVAIRPDGLETVGLIRQLAMARRPYVELASQRSQDSDDIAIWTNRLRLRLHPGLHTQVFGLLGWEQVDADQGSPFVAQLGDTGRELLRGMLGIEQDLGAAAGLRLEAGTLKIEDGSSETVGLVELRWRPSDALRIRLRGQRDVFAVSPRAAELGIMQDEIYLQLAVAPDFNWRLQAEFALGEFSDDNAKWNGRLTATRAVIRRQRWQGDLGLSASYTHFDQNLENGYYDPDRFESYMLVMHNYFGFSENRGLSLSATAGVQRDEAMDAYNPAAGLSGEATLGIWQDTLFKLRFSASYGVSDVGDNYLAAYLGLLLRWRFD